MKRNVLVTGDILTIALLTLLGFATHGEANVSFLPRMSTTFFPVFISWFLLAPWFGLFDHEIVTDLKLLWRPPLAMLFIAPLAVILRAALLNTAALPFFTLVLGSTNALGMLLWRALYIFLEKRGMK